MGSLFRYVFVTLVFWMVWFADGGDGFVDSPVPDSTPGLGVAYRRGHDHHVCLGPVAILDQALGEEARPGAAPELPVVGYYPPVDLQADLAALVDQCWTVSLADRHVSIDLGDLADET